MAASRATRRASAAARCVVPRRPHFFQSYRGAGRQSAERAGRSAIPRDSLSSSGALERRALRGARDSAGRPAVSAYLRCVPRLPPPPGVRHRCEGFDLRAVQEAGIAGVGRDELTAGTRGGGAGAGGGRSHPSPLSPPPPPPTPTTPSSTPPHPPPTPPPTS